MKHNDRRRISACALAAVILIAAGFALPARAQKLDNFDRERGKMMLNNVRSEIKKSYYDPKFHGLDLDARFKEAEEKIKQATSLGQVFGIIAQVVLDLDDSHAFFIPPTRAARTDYGWEMQMVGDKCFVMAVKPGSDAEAKGLKVGDEIYTVGGFGPTRENMWKMNYLFKILRPQPGLRVEVLEPNGSQRQLDIMAKVTQEKRVIDLTGSDGGGDYWNMIREMENEAYMDRHRYYEMEGGAFIWKMPAFDLSEKGIDDIMGKIVKGKSLVLDLRGNGGGYLLTLQRLLGYFADRDIKIGDEKSRKETKPVIAKARDRVFKGKLVILVDSESGSAAELFARVAQLEKLGTVIGDRTPGKVMVSKPFFFDLGTDTVVRYGASITVADLIMTDGKSLERIGVTPDKLLLPTKADLAAKRDPVLARGAELAGINIDPEKAGALFPVEWRK
ncbi:MAG TPA: S41 family peptidase [Blastocatellia bacterium]|nr:S41 family peptidase [Blastocatellia bacterium]